jgi:L-asparaginase
MKKRIIFITTGGTIEKTYDEQSGTLSNRGSQLKEMLSTLRYPYLEIIHRDLLCKDSLDMSDKDRQIITDTVEQLLPEKCPIVILHGTDTMELTASHMYFKLSPLDVPIVLTGAMKPFGFINSDALQNLTEAVLAAQLLSPGMYVVMHGQVHKMPGVRKNRELGTFSS